MKPQRVATTRLSSKGQIVIPETVRKRLGLAVGTEFVVVGRDDVVILKAVKPPSWQEFGELLTEARRQARSAGLRQRDVKAAVAKARGRT